MLGTIGLGGCGGIRGAGEKKREREEGVRRIWCQTERGLGGSKGDTEGPRVSLPNHCVALRGKGQGGGGWEDEGGSYKEEGEVEEEEERR